MKFWGKILTNPLKIQTGPLGPYDPMAPFCATIYSNNAWKESLSLVEMRTQPSFSPSYSQCYCTMCTALQYTAQLRLEVSSLCSKNHFAICNKFIVLQRVRLEFTNFE